MSDLLTIKQVIFGDLVIERRYTIEKQKIKNLDKILTKLAKSIKLDEEFEKLNLNKDK